MVIWNLYVMAYHAVIFFNLVSDHLFKSTINILCWRPGAQLGMVGLWRNIGRIFSIQLRMNFNPRFRLTLKHTFVLIKNPTYHTEWRVFFKGPKCLTGQQFSTCFRWSHSLLHKSWTHLLLAIGAVHKRLVHKGWSKWDWCVVSSNNPKYGSWFVC